GLNILPEVQKGYLSLCRLLTHLLLYFLRVHPKAGQECPLSPGMANVFREEAAGSGQLVSGRSSSPSAVGPFSLSRTFNRTRCPSRSAPSPDFSSAFICTNTSAPPSSGVAKPKPLRWLKNLTVPRTK